MQKIAHNVSGEGSEQEIKMKMFVKTELEDWFEAVLNVSSVCTAQHHRHFLLTLFRKNDEVLQKGRLIRFCRIIH